MKSVSPFVLLLLVLLSIPKQPAFAGAPADSTGSDRSSALRVYIDCQSCDMDYIRKEIVFVNYVRDRTDAAVHVLVTLQGTGSGGNEYTLSFIGKQMFAGLNDTLTFVTKATDTDDYIRHEMVRVLKLGLIRYVSHTELARKFSISFQQPEQLTEARDSWNYWVFKMSGQGYFNGEKSRKYASIYGSLNADRVTADLKMSFSLYQNYNDSKYEFDTETFRSITRSKGFNSLVVFSLDDHWSFGGSIYGSSSSYRNIDVSLSAAPALEYNIYPYSESTRRQLKLQYLAGFTHARYIDETIYDKMGTDLAFQKVSATLDLKEPWGSFCLSVGEQQYFYDFSKNDLFVNASVSFQLLAGLAINFWINYSAIHDQIELPRADATQDDVVLQRKALESQYSYYASVGFSYSFGAIYNNIVNPRF